MQLESQQGCCNTVDESSPKLLPFLWAGRGRGGLPGYKMISSSGAGGGMGAGWYRHRRSALGADVIRCMYLVLKQRPGSCSAVCWCAPCKAGCTYGGEFRDVKLFEDENHSLYQLDCHFLYSFFKVILFGFFSPRFSN